MSLQLFTAMKAVVDDPQKPEGLWNQSHHEDDRKQIVLEKFDRVRGIVGDPLTHEPDGRHDKYRDLDHEEYPDDSYYARAPDCFHDCSLSTISATIGGLVYLILAIASIMAVPISHNSRMRARKPK